MSETEGHQKKPHPQLLLQVLKGSTKQINYTYVFSISKKILLKFKTKQWFTAGKCFLIHIKTPAKTDTRDIRECFIRDFFTTEGQISAEKIVLIFSPRKTPHSTSAPHQREQY